MKKVFIVDDENLVRRGIISTFPWEKHGFTVIGDACCGEKALDLIRHVEVDLLITDLAMPGMSGLELIKQVRAEHLEIEIVILTCHDNFKFIQDAMKMGVLDYIIKTEIEDNVIEETLTRISEKMQKERNCIPVKTVDTFDVNTVKAGILISGRRRHCSVITLLNLGIQWITRHTLIEIDKLTWFIPLYEAWNGKPVMDEILSAMNPEHWVLTRISGIRNGMGQKTIADLKCYRRRVLFYNYTLGRSSYEFSMDSADMERLCSQKSEDSTEILAQWSELGWVYSDITFEHMLLKTRMTSADSAKLWGIFNNMVLEWDRLLSMKTLHNLLDSLDDFLFWHDWEIWITTFRAEILKRVRENTSVNITENVMKAIEYIKSDTRMDATESEIANKVNMSRSNFSQCFKKVTGKSFTEYFKSLKLEKAESMILRTDEHIFIIAGKCGFSDYRYFSRIFREYTGMLPNDYRKFGCKKNVLNFVSKV